MKLLKVLSLVALVAALLPLTLQSKVKDTLHNLNNRGITVNAPGGTNQVCLPCHTPHFSNPDSEYLWNHVMPDDTQWVLRPDADKATILAHGSRLCLSCHDGSVALDAYGLPDGNVSGTGSSNFISAIKRIGPDLTTHHPIGNEYPLTSSRYEKPIGYDPTDPTSVLPGPGESFSVTSSDPTLASSRGVPLVEGTVQCESCHFAHGSAASDGRMFLRVDNSVSALCSQCHVN